MEGKLLWLLIFFVEIAHHPLWIEKFSFESPPTPPLAPQIISKTAQVFCRQGFKQWDQESLTSIWTKRQGD
jgi:hypothetical protein